MILQDNYLLMAATQVVERRNDLSWAVIPVPRRVREMKAISLLVFQLTGKNLCTVLREHYRLRGG